MASGGVLGSFVDGRVAQVARTSEAGIGGWSDTAGRGWTSCGLITTSAGDDTIWPVVEVLERAAYEERPFNIGVVYVHSANPAGAEKVMQALRRWGYNVRSAAGSPQVGYLSDVD